MSTEDLARLADRYAEAKNRHDVDAILAVCAEDCFYESVGQGLRVEGKEALQGFFSALFAALPDYYGDFDGIAYGEDTTVVWGRFGGTTRADFMGLELTPGRKVEVPVTFVCTFRDGQLTSDTGYFDVATMAEQAGLPLEALRPAATPSA